MAKPRPIRLKDAPKECYESYAARVQSWRELVADFASDPERARHRAAVAYGLESPTHTWRLPYDHRRAY